MNNNGNQIFIMKKICVDFCVSIFSKSRNLPEPVSEPEPEPGFKVGTGTGIGTGKFLTGSATLVVIPLVLNMLLLRLIRQSLAFALLWYLVYLVLGMEPNPV